MTRKILFVSIISLIFTDTVQAQCWSQVAAGWFHNVGIQTNGTLWSWGKNDVGQLGDGTNTNRSSPVQIGADNDWTVIAIGDNHNMALKNDGTLWAWGLNNSGQLGDGTLINKDTPVQVGTANDWQAVSLGHKFTIALKNNGEMWAWGEQDVSRLGYSSVGDVAIPTRIGTASDWITIDAGHDYGLALKTNGTLWGWGSQANGCMGNGFSSSTLTTPTQSGTDSDWSKISTGQHTTLAVKNDGTLWSWGLNTFGAVGNGSPPNIHSLTPVQISTFAYIFASMGRYHTRAVRNDGTLWSWGYNNTGQLGDGTTTNRFTPVAIGTGINWIAALGGESHTVAISATNSLYAWGSNIFGQLGDGTNVAKLAPEAIGTPCTLGIPDTDYGMLRIYPNPISDLFTIDLNVNISTEMQILITNSLGQVLESYATLPTDGMLRVATSNWATGLYFVSIISEGKSYMAKVVKQ